MIADNLRELLAAWHAVGYWLVYATTVVLLLTCLLRLHRVKEKHHGYYGAVLAAMPWWWVRVIGWLLLADDLYQHWTQSSELEGGKTPRADFSPIHRAYVGLYRWIAARVS